MGRAVSFGGGGAGKRDFLLEKIFCVFLFALKIRRDREQDFCASMITFFNMFSFLSFIVPFCSIKSCSYFIF